MATTRNATNTTGARGRIGRAPIVWAALAGAMTLAAGALTVAVGPVRTGTDLSAAAITTPGATWTERLFSFGDGVERHGFEGIVIHHSGTTSGSADAIRRAQESRGIPSLGFHFVIGNGHGAEDGLIEVGERWTRQQPGMHAIGPDALELNERTIGVCVVGDGDRRPLSAAQFRSLVQLVRALQREYGIDAADVVLHRDVAATASPGRLFPELDFEERLVRLGSD